MSSFEIELALNYGVRFGQHTRSLEVV